MPKHNNNVPETENMYLSARYFSDFAQDFERDPAVLVMKRKRGRCRVYDFYFVTTTICF